VYFPRAWVRKQREIDTDDGKRLLNAWGFGDDEAQAAQEAERRLQRQGQWLAGDVPEEEAGDDYDYGSRPLREEILQVLGPDAILTRNRHGAVVLNAAKMLFLDVDLAQAGGLGLLGRLFGRKDPVEAALERLRERLRGATPATTFRLYRTAAGMRALAIDREFDPVGPETQALMERTDTDVAFALLCRSQKSFRARLTPKPWRCGLAKPPGEHPRIDDAARRAFADWCKAYERAVESRATCRFLETIGAGAALPRLKPLIELHDQATRCTESLQLA